MIQYCPLIFDTKHIVFSDYIFYYYIGTVKTLKEAS